MTPTEQTASKIIPVRPDVQLTRTQRKIILFVTDFVDGVIRC